MKKLLFLFSTILFAFFFLSCSQNVSQDKNSLLGTWEGICTAPYDKSSPVKAIFQEDEFYLYDSRFFIDQETNAGWSMVVKHYYTVDGNTIHAKAKNLYGYRTFDDFDIYYLIKGKTLILEYNIKYYGQDILKTYTLKKKE
ncbi:hypothetical protein FUT79_08980 [Treponema phagedenis]|uniref:hypothetical protein n=1 Tax=Treponema phagedenis TaxID=162 RepID=UPI0011E71107|nr:hypothetical protein [Treponema phagedenis]QEJ95322.1 hypothetical protein FUT79_08980 [Treponema phagedenis]